jgi:hypothetical protein
MIVNSIGRTWPTIMSSSAPSQLRPTQRNERNSGPRGCRRRTARRRGLVPARRMVGSAPAAPRVDGLLAP